jgi:hypothetical protein
MWDSDVGRPTIAAWVNIVPLPSRNWVCGYCGVTTGNDKGFTTQDKSRCVLICPNCMRPTYFEADRQVPGASFGNMVNNLPAELNPLYQEARNCMIVSAYTASVLVCRKILMHVAVEKNAQPNQSFKSYVEYLIAANIIPGHFKTWVDHIREKSNEANHEIVVMGRKEAEDLLSFTEMLLKVIYEYPYRAAQATAS